MDAIKTTALTIKQQEKVQICETNLVRRIVGVNRADKTRMNQLRVEIGVKESCKKKLVRIRVAWDGHMK